VLVPRLHTGKTGLAASQHSVLQALRLRLRLLAVPVPLRRCRRSSCAATPAAGWLQRRGWWRQLQPWALDSGCAWAACCASALPPSRRRGLPRPLCSLPAAAVGAAQPVARAVF
jgi:hypothetical protein